MSRFVRPDVVTLPLSEGDTITVKRRLSTGDLRATSRRGIARAAGGRPDRVDTGVDFVLAYLLDWTLKDDSGRVFVIRDQPAQTVEAALDALDPDDFAEILTAIEGHERRVSAERSEEKKQRAGAPSASPISPSPDGVTGPLNTSEPSTLMTTP